MAVRFPSLFKCLSIPVLIASVIANPAFADSSASDWLAQSDATKESQPHWMTPLVTVTPRLEQEFRYDQSWQSRPGDIDLTNYGGGKGLELIPTQNTEIIVGVPAYQRRESPTGTQSGWADESLLFKYRLRAANEENGNYIVTGFIGLSVPTGTREFSSHHTVITPTLAVGHGWGSRESGFDIQSTLGIAIPTASEKELGMTITWNTALQAHVFGKLWPEVETNYTHYEDGPNNGKDQLAVTVGAIAGRFVLSPRVRLIFGGGYQKAISSFRTFEHTWLMTARAAF